MNERKQQRRRRKRRKRRQQLQQGQSCRCLHAAVLRSWLRWGVRQTQQKGSLLLRLLEWLTG
jgi:hypothetical protein